MRVVAILYRDGVTVNVSATYMPNLYYDYMNQASEMCMPFFMLGYHMKKAYLQGGVYENTKAKQRPKEGNPKQG